jgi:hypothetical protein
VTTGCIEATILAAAGAALRLPERHRDVHRGSFLITILGPCRALEPPETEDQIASGGTG